MSEYTRTFVKKYRFRLILLAVYFNLCKNQIHNIDAIKFVFETVDDIRNINVIKKLFCYKMPYRCVK